MKYRIIKDVLLVYYSDGGYNYSFNGPQTFKNIKVESLALTTMADLILIHNKNQIYIAKDRNGPAGLSMSLDDYQKNDFPIKWLRPVQIAKLRIKNGI